MRPPACARTNAKSGKRGEPDRVPDGTLLRSRWELDT
jgi:hypothetical protein